MRPSLIVSVLECATGNRKRPRRYRPLACQTFSSRSSWRMSGASRDSGTRCSARIFIRSGESRHKGAGPSSPRTRPFGEPGLLRRHHGKHGPLVGVQPGEEIGKVTRLHLCPVGDGPRRRHRRIAIAVRVRFAASVRDCVTDWLGRQDSNLRMAAPKAAALPLGDAPMCEAASYSEDGGDGNPYSACSQPCASSIWPRWIALSRVSRRAVTGPVSPSPMTNS